MKYKLRNTEEDQTREVREVISENSQIEFEGTAFTHGMLPEDLEKEYGAYGFIGDVGAGKILPIHGRKDLTIKGGKFINPDHAFPYDKDFGTRRHHITGELTFLDIYDSENIDLYDIEYTGGHKYYYPDGHIKFVSKYEYSHGLDISSSKNIYAEGLTFGNLPGDFVYIRQGDKGRAENLSFVNCTVLSNARQGAAPADGKNIYFKNFRVKDSARGGNDNEPPKTQYHIIDQVIDGAWYTTRLLGVPMGGDGTVDGFYIKDAIFETSSPTMLLLADRVNSFRKNITFEGSRRLSGWGSSHGAYHLEGAQGVDLNNEHLYLKERRAGVAVEITYCENVVIRNCNFINGEYIEVRDTPLSEIKVYNNHQKLKYKIFSYDVPRIDAPDYLWYRQEYGRHGNGKWQEAMAEYKTYMAERESRATYRIEEIEEYDYKKYGEDFGIRKPDFKPYLGKAGVVVEDTPWMKKDEDGKLVEDIPRIWHTEELIFNDALELMKDEEALINYMHSFILHEKRDKIEMVIPMNDVIMDFKNDNQFRLEVKVNKIHYIWNVTVNGWNKELIPEDLGGEEEPQVPVITTKEKKEQRTLPFSSSKTNIESEQQVGKEGIEEITYLLTFKDSVQISKEEIKKEVIVPPIDEIVYETPEPVITTKEAKITEPINFEKRVTNIASEASKGETGILEITYKVTYEDDIEVSKKEINRETIKQPIDEVTYEESIPEKKWYQNKMLWILGGIIILIIGLITLI